MIAQILFIIILAAAIYLFSKNVRTIRRNILLGKDTDRSDNPALRWKTMAKIALGRMWSLRHSNFPVPELDHIRYVCMVDDGRARADLGYAPSHDIEATVRAVDDLV